MEIIFLSGLSGSGKTTALKALEDAGYFCIDNLPFELIKKLLDILEISSNHLNKVAIVCDIREPRIKEVIKYIKKWVSKLPYSSKFVFLTADKNELIKRFEQTRRSHPLSILEGLTLAEAIEKEKQLLEEIKNSSDEIIDTTSLNVNQLRRLILKKFGKKSDKGLIIQLISFGFKYGLPPEADNVWDVRFIQNPYFIDELKDTTGLDKETYEFVINQEKTQLFLKLIEEYLTKMIPFYAEEGKSYLSLAFGCTGGKHRSVAIVEYFRNFLEKNDYNIEVIHRDLER
ncbi:RNase adapter RapZ [Hippea alviniae]|uniref:RNase adapter RapZ n=1 Tax=Hippea alviniae TaxID=1279027 RepID=UPI0003FCC3B2|nr:RNase adapter RapZ [Hippea alviniae]